MDINQEFIAAVEPLVEFLRKNSNPHAVVIVDQTGGQLYSGELTTARAFDGSVPDQTPLNN